MVLAIKGSHSAHRQLMLRIGAGAEFTINNTYTAVRSPRRRSGQDSNLGSGRDLARWLRFYCHGVLRFDPRYGQTLLYRTTTRSNAYEEAG